MMLLLYIRARNVMDSNTEKNVGLKQESVRFISEPARNKNKPNGIESGFSQRVIF